ncbi:MAG TPA: porin family protein [Ohtaekwangia sp.]|nr:porin family protein [Ohtaekwangia sp.]
MKRFYFVLLCCLILGMQAYGQDKKKRTPTTFNKQKKTKENDQFLQKQWWLGFKGGANVSKIDVESAYAIYSPINYDAAETGKQYDEFKHPGSQFSFEVSFYFKGFTASFQPTFQHSRFRYTTDYTWNNSEDASEMLQTTYASEQKVNHLLLPLILKYEVIGNKLRPYIQVGVFQAICLDASKSITVTGIDYASGGTNEFERDPIVVGAKDLFAKYYWGLIGGAGVYYNLGNVRLNLDIQYKHGLSNIASVENRYDNDMLVGAGDVLDDMNLNSVAVSVGCLFPMRFLTSGFKSLDRK